MVTSTLTPRLAAFSSATPFGLDSVRDPALVSAGLAGDDPL